MDPIAENFNPEATKGDGSCTYPPVLECADPNAENYNHDATEDDVTCTYDTANSIKNDVAQGLELYPNPCDKVLFIQAVNYM